MKIKCLTLFDITKTNVSNRRGDSDRFLSRERQQQSNLETLLQIISLRSQPEDITDPIITVENNPWGKKCWSFTFVVNYGSIFLLNGDDLGSIKADCNGVPMITGLDEEVDLNPVLYSTGLNKNIHFEIE